MFNYADWDGRTKYIEYSVINVFAGKTLNFVTWPVITDTTLLSSQLHWVVQSF